MLMLRILMLSIAHVSMLTKAKEHKKQHEIRETTDFLKLYIIFITLTISTRSTPSRLSLAYKVDKILGSSTH